MLEILTLLTDIALGALAYRLARKNQRDHKELVARVGKLEEHVGLAS